MREEGFSFIVLTLEDPGTLASLLWCQLSSSTQEVCSMKQGCPAPPECSPHISPRPGCPVCPSTHHCAALPVARGHVRELSTPKACGKQLWICRPLPRLRRLNCPFLKQVLECLQHCPCVQRAAFPQNIEFLITLFRSFCSGRFSCLEWGECGEDPEVLLWPC